jgi:glutaredoxin
MKTNLILFTSKKCAPCKVLKENLTKSNIAVNEVDVDTEYGSKIASMYYIRSIPTLIDPTTKNMLNGNWPISKICEKFGLKIYKENFASL